MRIFDFPGDIRKPVKPEAKQAISKLAQVDEVAAKNKNAEKVMCDVIEAGETEGEMGGSEPSSAANKKAKKAAKKTKS